ncbi:LysR family transcriptional regulator [Klebsiella pneumoniae subsp. pneumoniae]|nr:LysR family transcriptional regulator [Klebsiella pneumoniae subsp. pneumoniae]
MHYVHLKPARHQSFSLAAEELNVTPAAVGQLVRSLEEVIGFPLFHRSNNRRAALVLTEPALRALPIYAWVFKA